VRKPAEWLPRPLTLVRLGLALFVLAWIFGPYALRSAVPIWLPFLIAVGLEVNFLVAGLRPARTPRPDRGPQAVDRERYGYGEDAEELLLVRDRGEELWIPYSGETSEEVDALIEQAREVPEEEAPPATPPDRRPLRRFLVGVALIGALALVFWFVEGRTGWSGLDEDTRAQAEARFSEEASRVAGKPVTIRCDEAGEVVGAVQHSDGAAVVGGELAYLTPERCFDLYRLAFEDEVRFNQTGRALAVLSHEAWHLRGVGDEGTTECYAFQSGVELAQRLGASEDEARRMMRRQFVESANRSGDYRVPPECQDDGRLDLAPEDGRFP
jgi:hypothetical protein